MSRRLNAIYEKVGRASFHISQLADGVLGLISDEAYRVSGEIYAGGTKHVYRAVHPPSLEPDGGLIFGDAIHNLRTAMDHLAWQLVAANGKQPPDTVTFPIRVSRCRRNPCTGRTEPTPLSLADHVSVRAIELIDSVQPYQRPDPVTDPLWLLHRLDIIDKHRYMLDLVATPHEASGWLDLDREGLPPYRIDVSRKPLRHGQIVAVVTFWRPHPNLEPEFNFLPKVVFSKAAPKAYREMDVIPELFRLWNYIGWELIPLFRECL